jgi:hypothetical protein
MEAPPEAGADMKDGHSYRVTVEPSDGSSGVIEFTHSNHDDIASIVVKLRVSTGLPAEQAAALGVGLKLMSAVVLEHRHDPLFSGIHAALGDFIRALKARQ